MTPSFLRHVSVALGTFIIAATVGATMSLGTAQNDRQPPDLTGAWVLNRDLSDQMQGRRGAGGQEPGERPRRGGFGGGAMGRRGGGGRGNMPSREEMERMRAAMEIVVRPPLRLTIVRSDAGLVLTDEEGRTTRLTLDGKKVKSTLEGIQVETSAKWADGKLRVERKFKGNLKAVDEYSTTADPKQLVVETRLEGGPGRGGRGRSFRRVYDLAERSESFSSAPWLA